MVRCGAGGDANCSSHPFRVDARSLRGVLMGSDRKQDRKRFYGAPWQRVRARIGAQGISYCYLCGGKRGPIRYDLKYPHPLSYSLDHVIPASSFDHLPDTERLAAMLDESNLKPTHKVCNDEKSGGLAPAGSLEPLQPNPGRTWGSQ